MSTEFWINAARTFSKPSLLADSRSAVPTSTTIASPATAAISQPAISFAFTNRITPS